VLVHVLPASERIIPLAFRCSAAGRTALHRSQNWHGWPGQYVSRALDRGGKENATVSAREPNHETRRPKSILERGEHAARYQVASPCRPPHWVEPVENVRLRPFELLNLALQRDGRKL